MTKSCWRCRFRNFVGVIKIRDRKLYEEIYNEVCRILSAMQHYNGGVIIEAELTYEELKNGWVYNSKYGKMKEV